MDTLKVCQSRRSDWSVVHSLDHTGLAIADLAEAEKFYSTFGFDVKRNCASLDIHTYGNDHLWLRITRFETKNLDHIGFGAFADDLEPLAERLKQNNIRVEYGGQAKANSLWFRDPLGVLAEIKAAPKFMPDKKICTR